MPDRLHATRLRTSDLFNPGGRVIHATSDNAAVSIGLPRDAPRDQAGGAPWWIHAASKPGQAAFVAYPEPRIGKSPSECPATALIEATGVDDTIDRTGARLPGGVIVEVRASTLLWVGDTRQCQLYVVTGRDEVHELAQSAPGAVRSEQLDIGDRVVFLSESVANSLVNLELALEMALGDDPSPAASCTWLLDAADDDGATEGMFVGIWRRSGT